MQHEGFAASSIARLQEPDTGDDTLQPVQSDLFFHNFTYPRLLRF